MLRQRSGDVLRSEVEQRSVRRTRRRGGGVQGRMATCVLVTCTFALIFALYNFLVSPGPPSPQLRKTESLVLPSDHDAFGALVARVFVEGTRARVRVEYRAFADGAPYFTLAVTGGQLHIASDSVGSALGGLNYYCLHYAACTTSWGVAAQPALPRELPALESPTLTRRRWARHVYYGNVCTQSYSQPWWTWTNWEKELDHLALRGVTLPLIITGREVVMRQLLLEQGLSEREILAFFTGPAFLAWHRMGNLKSFAGPLPASYLDHSKALTRAILKRARALGMTPVLPGFSGHVPDELATLFARLGRAKESEFSRLPLWSGFPQAYSALTFVEPTSEVYVQLGARFIEIQRALFGEDAGHFYSVDQFNEVDPRSADPVYLERAAVASYAALRKGDPGAVWVLQGWLFVFHSAFWTQPRIAAYLAGVPKGGLLVLDLVSEATPGYVATKSYGGHPYVWNALINFGGSVGMRGNAETVMNRPYTAKRLPESSADGVGITMEAINQNPLMYELVLDHAWNPQPRDFGQWLRTWVRARYGYVPDAGGVLIEVRDLSNTQ